MLLPPFSLCLSAEKSPACLGRCRAQKRDRLQASPQGQLLSCSSAAVLRGGTDPGLGCGSKPAPGKELGCSSPHLKPGQSWGGDLGGIPMSPHFHVPHREARWQQMGVLFASLLIFSFNLVSLSCCCKCINVFWFIWAADLFFFIGSKINCAVYAT